MNAVRVLPEPVGAATRVWRPEPIAGQACCWASVGPGKARSNQAETAGWKADWGIEALSDGAVAGSATAWAGADPGLLSGSRPGARGVGWLLVHLLPRPLMTLRPSLLATALLAATGMASAADASVPTGPLPRTVVPSEVALQLTIDPAQPRFSG